MPEESENNISWIFLAAAIIAVCWGVWLKVNEPKEPEKKIEWIRLDGKLVERESRKPYQGKQEIPFEQAPGTIQFEYNYVDGVRQGEAIEYFGGVVQRVKTHSNYIDGVRQGLVISYFRSGVTQSVGTSVDGFLNGLMTFYNADGTVRRREIFETSAPVGDGAVVKVPELIEEEAEEGEVFIDDEVVDEAEPPLILDSDGDPFTGIQVGTFRTGEKAKAFEHRHAEGRRHGLHQGWDPNGLPEYERPYFKGKKHGTWKGWAEGGKLIREDTFHHGAPVGTAKRWHPGGEVLRQETQFVHGSEHGTRKIFDKDGKKYREITFDHGRQTRSVEWDRNGEVTKDESTPLTDGLALTVAADEGEIVSESVELGEEVPEDVEGLVGVTFRYRVSTEETDPPADVARPFQITTQVDGVASESSKFDGKLGGWQTHNERVQFLRDQTLVLQVSAQPGTLVIDLAGIRLYNPAEADPE